MDKFKKLHIEQVLNNHLQKWCLDDYTDRLYYNLFGSYLRYWGIIYDTKKRIVNIREDEEILFNNCKVIDFKYFVSYLIKNSDVYREFMDSQKECSYMFIIDNIMVFLYSYTNAIKEIICYSSEKPTRLLEGIRELKVPKDDSKFTFITADTSGNFRSTELNIKHLLDVSLDNYNEDLPYDKMKDFCEGDESGLMVFSGIPGSGKSTLIKKLIHDCTDTPFLLLSSETLLNINSTNFINYLIRNASNSVLVLEDCDIILQSRDNSNNTIMSTLLNLSDGLLGDALNLKFICTYNTSDDKVDKAVLRKGRLKLKYTFSKLSADRVHKLNPKLNTPMTLADLYNLEDNELNKKKTTKIGF